MILKEKVKAAIQKIIDNILEGKKEIIINSIEKDNIKMYN